MRAVAERMRLVLERDWEEGAGGGWVSLVCGIDCAIGVAGDAEEAGEEVGPIEVQSVHGKSGYQSTQSNSHLCL